ncbi:MAG: hypothetical protein QXP34_01505 [Candidatus Aenigmatarchaeota archaeon]
MDNKSKIVNFGLIALSSLLVLFAIIIFVASFLSIMMFFSYNSIQLQKIFEGKEVKNIVFSNPSFFEIKDFDVYGNFSIFSKSFEIVKIEDVNLKNGETKEIEPKFNLSSMQEEFMMYVLELFNKTKDEKLVREEILNELSKSKFNLLIRLNMQDFVKFEFLGEINASKLISLPV